MSSINDRKMIQNRNLDSSRGACMAAGPPGAAFGVDGPAVAFAAAAGVGLTDGAVV
jgi:hypothetical protein